MQFAKKTMMYKFSSLPRQLTLLGLIAMILPLLAGCDLANNQLKIDRGNNMEFQDYRDALAPRLPDVNDLERLNDADVPEMQDYIADPSDRLKAMPLVSVSMNQTIPLRDALFELADQAEYDIELDPRIRGSIIFTARNKPFDIVIDRIADIAGLRYKFEDDILRVELDNPYHEVYKINYLNFVRTNSGQISNNVAVVTGDGADTGSNFSASTSSEANFWAELESNLTQILGTELSSSVLRTQNDPRITAVSRNPAPVEPLVITEEGEITAPEGTQAPAPVLQVDSLPTDDLGGSGGDAETFNAQFSMNRQAGIISVFATERSQKQVKKYLDLVRKAVTSQVLIEAKVLEVSLTDEFSAGIDWAAVRSEFAWGFDAATARAVLDPQTNPVSSGFLTYAGNDFASAIDAISRFGTVNALASPRLTVMNNQSAVLNVADNLVFFELEIDIEESDDPDEPDRINIDTEIRNVPEGVLINVMPSIDLDTNQVAMSLRPTITRVLRFENDPGVAFAVALRDDIDNIEDLNSQVPVVNVQEMDSVVKIASGQTLVMGGLLQDRVTSTQNGVPVLSEIPLVGAAFRNQSDKVEKTELVIFLKATIIEDSDSITDADRDLYRTFSGDRRPLDL